jgi:hypothetical protein
MNKLIGMIDGFGLEAPMAQRPQTQQSQQPQTFTLAQVGKGLGVILLPIVAFAFWLGIMSNTLSTLKESVDTLNKNFTKLNDRVTGFEKDLEALKQVRFAPKAVALGIPNPKITFAPARPKETFNISYQGTKQQPPMDVTFIIEEVGANFVKVKPNVALRRGDLVMKLPDIYPTVTVSFKQPAKIQFLVDVDNLPLYPPSPFQGKYVAFVVIALIERLPNNDLVFASQRLDAPASAS